MQSHEFNILIYCLFIYVCQFLYFICVGVAKFSGMWRSLQEAKLSLG